MIIKIKRPDRFEMLVFSVMTLALIALIGLIVLIFSIESCERAKKNPEVEKNEEFVFYEEDLDSIPAVMYEYSDGSTGSLKYNKFAPSIGVEIEPR